MCRPVEEKNYDVLKGGLKTRHTWTRDVFVNNLGNRNWQITYHKRKKNGEHHFCDAPLVTFRLHLSLILDSCRLGEICMLSIIWITSPWTDWRHIWWWLRWVWSLIIWYSILVFWVLSHSHFRPVKKWGESVKKKLPTKKKKNKTHENCKFMKHNNRNATYSCTTQKILV